MTEPDPYTPDQQRVSDYLQSITGGEIGSGDDPVGFLIASHAAINELRREAESSLREAITALTPFEEAFRKLRIITVANLRAAAETHWRLTKPPQPSDGEAG